MIKIAYVSFEYPPQTGFGGIGTYVFQASRLLAQRGNHVEVFSASLSQTNSSSYEDGLWIHRIACNRENFNHKIVNCFSERHYEVKFDLLESPEYGADGLEIARKFPRLCFVVKCHTPQFLIDRINPLPRPNFINRVRIVIGALRRFQSPVLKGSLYRKEFDAEYQMALLAHTITSPSRSLQHIIAQEWDIAPDTILIQPYPYIPMPMLSSINIQVENNKTITFVGRLEVRKGILVLAKAIPDILKFDPKIKFNFVGTPMGSPDARYNMKEYLLKELLKYKDNLLFHGRLDLHGIAKILDKSSICIFPSIWENFPNVCLEAMSAGRAIIGTNSGGMAEMLSNEAGVIIPPSDSKAIADAVINLISNNNKRIDLGLNARRKIEDAYNGEVIGALMEKQYHVIINNHGQL